MPTLKLVDVSFTYGYEPFIENLNLTLSQADECVLFHGHNGAGKSTLLNIICDLLPYQGTIVKDNIAIGYLPYDTPLLDTLSGLDNVRFFYQNFNKKRLDEKSESYQSLLAALSINYLDRKVKEYSSGERRKLALLCILLSKADIIILDEPFVALDAQSSEKLIKLINREKKERLFLVTTHSFSLAKHIANRVVVIEHGKIIGDGSPNIIEDVIQEDSTDVVSS